MSPTWAATTSTASPGTSSGASPSNPVRGYKSGSLRTQSAFVANISYGLNIENIIRFEGYDQAIVKDKTSGFDNEYFSGAGLLASLNGPWLNTLFSCARRLASP